MHMELAKVATHIALCMQLIHDSFKLKTSVVIIDYLDSDSSVMELVMHTSYT